MKPRSYVALVVFCLWPVGMTHSQIDPGAVDHLARLQPDADFLTFPETRERPITLLDELPEGWSTRTIEDLHRFAASAQPGEHFVFQIGILAHRRSIEGLTAHWPGISGIPAIPASGMTCFNTSGIDFRGNAFTRTLHLPAGRIQPLWFGVQIPQNARGSYRTTITVSATGAKDQTVDVVLHVAGDAVQNHGYNQGKNLSRLAWLNTTVGVDDKITKGFQHIRREDRVIHILGRSVGIGRTGLPSTITSFFEPSNQFLVKDGKQLLHTEIRFVVQKEDGSVR